MTTATTTEAPATPTTATRARNVAYTNFHIFADDPHVGTRDGIYPSVSVQAGIRASFEVSLTGDAEQRATVARQFREAADFIESWRPSDD